MALNLTDQQYYAAASPTWSFKEDYSQNDTVEWNGQYYVALMAVEGQEVMDMANQPDMNAVWQLIEGAVNALGDNRFISLEDIINNYMVLYVDDDMHGSKKRLKVEAFAQRAIQEFSYDTFQVKSFEYELGDLPRIPMPKDFVEVVQLNYVDSYGQEYWLVERKDSGNPTSYAQSDNGSLIYDENGNAITMDNSITLERHNANDLNDSNDDILQGYYGGHDSYGGYRYGKRYYLDTEKTSSAYTYVISDGFIEVDASLLREDQSSNIITIRYVSDGLSNDLSEIKIHKFAEQAIYDTIYFEDIARKLNVPANEKERAKRRMKGKMKQAKYRLSNFSPRDLLQTLRAQARWIKT